MWFSVVCALIDNEYVSSQWAKCCRLTISKIAKEIFVKICSHLHALHYANELLVRVRLAFQKLHLFSALSALDQLRVLLL